MKVLKNIVLGFLSFLLFPSLFIFGLAFTVNSTLLNPDFVTAELNRLDLSSFAEELMRQPAEDELPEEFSTALTTTIVRLEPEIKEELSAAIYPIYDYLLGKKPSPELALTLRNTFLSSTFIVSVIEGLDLSALAGEALREQITKAIPEDIEFMVNSIDAVMAKLEPVLKKELIAAADPVLAYLLGESQGFRVVVSLEPVVLSVKEPIKEALLESPPPQLAGLPRSQIEQHFDEYFTEFTRMLPPTVEFNESMLGTESQTRIAEALVEGEQALGEARQFISYFQLGYRLLLVFMVLLILGIVLLKREVKGATRRLGITFLIYGALEYGGTFVIRYFIRTQLPLAELPTPLQTWLPQFFYDLLASLSMFSLALLIGGIALLIVSFVYKWRRLLA